METSEGIRCAWLPRKKRESRNKIGLASNRKTDDQQKIQMAVHIVSYTEWQSRLWSFQGRDTKLERFWLKFNCDQMKLPNFDNWSNGELSKFGHHFIK